MRIMVMAMAPEISVPRARQPETLDQIPRPFQKQIGRGVGRF
jgi:hypothetical protein